MFTAATPQNIDSALQVFSLSQRGPVFGSTCPLWKRPQEITQELQGLARRDHSLMDCCLVVILSHGCEVGGPGLLHDGDDAGMREWRGLSP